VDPTEPIGEAHPGRRHAPEPGFHHLQCRSMDSRRHVAGVDESRKCHERQYIQSTLSSPFRSALARATHELIVHAYGGSRSAFLAGALCRLRRHFTLVPGPGIEPGCPKTGDFKLSMGTGLSGSICPDRHRIKQLRASVSQMEPLVSVVVRWFCTRCEAEQWSVE
jgi:hypothetical protein